MPLVLGALSRVVPGDDGVSLAASRTDAGSSPGGDPQRLTILIMSAALMGAAVTIRELVKERAIFQREYAVGLVAGGRTSRARSWSSAPPASGRACW